MLRGRAPNGSDDEDERQQQRRGGHLGKEPATSQAPKSRGGRTKVRAVKRSKGSSSQTVEAIAGFETVQFKSETQRERFGVLMDEQFASTRWLDDYDMIAFGIQDVMRNLFAGTGFVDLFGMNYLTYRTITLEFLSSFELLDDITPMSISFRVLNRDYELSIASFAEHLGLTKFSERVSPPDEFDPFILWRCMSRSHLIRFGKAKVNDIEHPALRLWFRTLGGTFFGRPEVGTLTKEEVGILGRHLNVQQLQPWGLDIPLLVARHFLDVARSKLKTIRIGGLITCLLLKMGINIPTSHTPVETPAPLIDLEFLRTHHHWYLPVIHDDNEDVNEFYEQRWLVSKTPQRWMTLPSDRLPQLTPLPPREHGFRMPIIQTSYLIPEDLVYGLDDDMPQAPPPQHIPQQAPPAQNIPHHAPDPSPHDIYMAQMNFMNQRFTHHAVNQNLESYWRYHNEVESGIARGPHPTYYRGADTSGIFEEAGIDPTVWGPNYGATYGGFGGQFLDQFGRLRVRDDLNDDDVDDDE